MTILRPGQLANENILKATEDDLNDEQRQLYTKAVENYKQAYLGVFSVTKRGEAIQKSAFPAPRHITTTKDPTKF